MSSDSISPCSGCASRAAARSRIRRSFRSSRSCRGHERYRADVQSRSELIRARGRSARRCGRSARWMPWAASAYVRQFEFRRRRRRAARRDYDLIGSEIERTGLFALESCDYFNFLCIPPLVARPRTWGPPCLVAARATARSAVRMLIVDPPFAWHTADDALAGTARVGVSQRERAHVFSRACSRTTSCAATSNRSRPAAPSPACSRGAMRRIRCGASRAPKMPCCVPDTGRCAWWPRIAARGSLLRGVNTLQAVRSVEPHRHQAAHLAAGAAATADWQSLARAASGAVHRQLHRARYALGGRRRQPSAEVAQTVARTCARFSSSCTRTAPSARAAARSRISSCAIGASMLRTSGAANFNS